LLAVSAFVADVAFVALVVVAEVVAGKTFFGCAKRVAVSRVSYEGNILIFICLIYPFDFAHPP